MPSSWRSRAKPRPARPRGRPGRARRDGLPGRARIAQLDAAHEGLVFGRLDMRPPVDREPRYIGRIGLRDEHRDSLLIDWRAPAAAVFYQATAAEPARSYAAGCCARRVRAVVGVEDELLDSERLEPPDAARSWARAR